ncbi:MAG TPA: cation diffusion facilitator family transporter [Burkholderiaceae bacterium]
MAHAHSDHDHHSHGGAHDRSSSGHGHHHPGDPTAHGRAFGIAIALNVGFVAVEAAYAVIAHSTALMADAGHNLSDVLGLLLAWGATALARTLPNHRFTYGLRGTSILAAVANAALLFVACGAIGWEAAQRLASPPIVAGATVSVVAALGILVNGFSAWLFMQGSKTDLNVRGAYLHMVADAAISLGVAVGGVLILWTQWYWIDAVLSLLIVAVIAVGTWGLLRDSIRLALAAVPAHVDAAAIDGFLRQVSGVQSIHDLHIWGVSTRETALTVHLVMPAGHPGDGALQEVSHALHERFAIDHSTVQVDLGDGCHPCALLPRAMSNTLSAHEGGP